MSLWICYIVTLILFLALDFVGLNFLVKPTFERHIGDLLRPDLRYGPALAFYMVFIAGVIWFVSSPALDQDKPIFWIAGNAAFLGFLAYGTYEFTNLATLRGWSWSMVAIDLTWGTFLTAISAAMGVILTRVISA